MGIFELADKLKECKNLKKELEDSVKRLSEDIESYESQLVKAMVEQEMQNFSRAGQMFYLNTKILASPVADKKRELFETLKDQGFGDLVYETVNSQSLAAFVREQIEQNEEQLPDWLNGLVNTYEKTNIGMRKAK